MLWGAFFRSFLDDTTRWFLQSPQSFTSQLNDPLSLLLNELQSVVKERIPSFTKSDQLVARTV